MPKAPFVWFGGKSRASDLIWSKIGSDIGNYVEPFLGSCAVYLNRPKEFSGWSTLNDLDGNVVNFWRSLVNDPDLTAYHANQPVFEADLHARHLHLVNELPKLAGRLMADPNYFEPKLAGWWAWGINSWIGGSFCSGGGSWGAVLDDEGFPAFAKLGNGQGVNKKLPHLGNGGQGVNKQLPHLGDGGRGVNKQLPHLGDGGRGLHELRLEWLKSWFWELADLLHEARIACGSWERIMSVGTMTRNGVCGVVLDPPYANSDDVYAHDSNTVAHDVLAWCIENGDNPKLRIALCGYEGDYELPDSWECIAWHASGGYQGAEDRERIWFSPHCIKPKTTAQINLFEEFFA
jgi:DNA adenine methylase